MPSRLGARHRADQAALAGLLLGEIGRLPPADVPTLLLLVQEYAAASGTLAAEFYDRAREQARVRSRFTVPVAPPPAAEQVETSLLWATRGLRGDAPDAAAVRVLVDGVAQRLALNTGRDTLVDATLADSQAAGWARVPRGRKTCYFCAMLASRGAVYTSREAAGDGAQWHDHCHCGVEPVFRGQSYTPPPRVEDWEQLYAESTGGVGGREKLRAFRRAYEGRA